MKRASSEPTASGNPGKKFLPFVDTDGFTSDTVPEHHYQLGEDNYVVVKDFNDEVNVHIIKFKMDKSGRILPTEQDVCFPPFVWKSLSKEFDMIPLPSEKLQINIICDTLFLSSAWIKNKPFVSLQRYTLEEDFCRHFTPSVCLLTETEWNNLQLIREKVSKSCKVLMFDNFLKRKIIAEVSLRTPSINLQMEISDAEMVLSTSLAEILSNHIQDSIDEVFICNGCIENQPNQLGHECMTMNYETRQYIYGDLALFSIKIEHFAKDFVEKNIHIANYINETFLNDLDIDLLVTTAFDLYVASDPMPYRML